MKGAENLAPEPEFVNILRSPGINSQPGGSVRQPYLTYRPAWLHRLAESIPWLLKRLQILALDPEGKGGVERIRSNSFIRTSFVVVVRIFFYVH
jgi:hypothetical protein